jgi:hypothetical protein
MRFEHSPIADLEKASDEARAQTRKGNGFRTQGESECSSDEDIARAAKEKPARRFGPDPTAEGTIRPRGRFEIRVPNASYNGVQCDLKFSDGIAFTDDAGKARWFRQADRAYTVIDNGAAAEAK